MLKPIFRFYYSLDGACLVVQNWIFGRYFDTISGYLFLNMTIGILYFLLLYWIQHVYRINLPLIIGPFLLLLIPLFLYHTNKEINAKDEWQKMEDFKNLNIISRLLCLAYVMLMMIILPILIVLALFLRYYGYI